MTENPGWAPLRGIRVLEVGHIVAGPTAGMILRQLGAEVVKIEEPTRGDQARSSPVPGTFAYLNRGKRSVTINLKDAAGYADFQRLAATADVLVTNLGPGVARRLRITWDDLKECNAGLICAEISGYPPGPLENRPALDEVIQMHCGLARQTGPAGRPLRAGASVIDMTAGSFLVIGILCALRERETSGVGGVVGSSLFESGCFYMGQALATHQLSGKPSLSYAERDGGAARLHGWGIYDTFTTRDEQPLFIAVTSNTQWQKFCVLIGLEDLLGDPAYENNKDRLAARPTLVPLVADKVALRDREELRGALSERAIPCAPVLSPDDLLSDVVGSTIMQPLDIDTNVLRLPGPAVRRSAPENATVDRQPWQLPDLGADNDAYLPAGGHA